MNQSGRATLEAVIEVIVALLVLPPLVCCAFQALAMVIGVLVPWLVLAVIVLGAAACLGASMAVRRRDLPPIAHDNPPIPVPPVRRPHEIPDRRHDH